MVFCDTELEEEVILIDMPGMIELDLAIYPKSRNWCYNIGEHDLQIVSPKLFTKITREEINKGLSQIYIVVCRAQSLDNLSGIMITQIATTIIADNETEREVII
jgi:hypothetical protein